MPLTIVDRLAVLDPGKSIASPKSEGAVMYTLVSSRPAPVAYDKVRALIERFLVIDASKYPVNCVRPVEGVKSCPCK